MKYWIFVLLVIIVFTGYAKAGWQRTYGGPGANEEAECIKQTTDGGYIVVGTRDSMSGPFESEIDAYVVRLDNLGEEIWSNRLGGISADRAYSVTLSHDSGYIIAGGTYSSGIGSEDACLWKISETGETVWMRTYGGVNYDAGLSVAQTADGGYIISGYFGKYLDILGLIGGNVYLIKVDSEGIEDWSNTYGLPGSAREEGWEVIQTLDGGYMVTGASNTGDVLVLRADSTGDSLWARTYGGTYTDFGYSLLQSSDSNFVVAGYYGTREEMWVWYHGIYVLKLDSEGDTIWTTVFNIDYDSDNYGYSVVEVPGECYAVTGFANKFGSTGRDVVLVKLNSDGEVEWNRVYGDTLSDEGHSIINTMDGGFCMAGKAYVTSTDFYVIKTDSMGNIETANEPPYFTNCPSDTSIEYGDTLRLKFNVIDSETDLLTYTLEGPAGAYLEGDSVVVWIPSSPDSAGAMFSIIVCDPEYCDSCHFGVIVTTGIAEGLIIPDKYSISCYPNPFNGAISIEIALGSFSNNSHNAELEKIHAEANFENAGLAPADVENYHTGLEIYDINGRLVSKFSPQSVGENVPPSSGIKGRNTIEYKWQPEPTLNSGIYFIKTQVGTNTVTTKVIYLK